MGICKDIRSTVSGFNGLFTTQDLISALPGYKARNIIMCFQLLIYREGIAENTTPLTLIGLFRAVNGDESVRMHARNAHPVSVDGKHYDTMVAACRSKKLTTSTVISRFTYESKKAGYPVHTVTCRGYTITRSHNY